MRAEFWNDVATDASWAVLLRLRATLAPAPAPDRARATCGFTLIGGWAVYLWTRALKSKDIDIAIGHQALARLQEEFRLKKNPRLKKYEVVADGISVDIYVPFYSPLAIPPQALLAEAVSREGFSVPSPEALVLLKQQAEAARSASPKGEKDRVDILSLLRAAPFDSARYRALCQRFALHAFPQHLRSLVRSSRAEWDYLGIADPGKVKREKQRLLELLA